MIIMDICNDSKLKFLLMVPILFLILNALYFNFEIKAINSALLRQKRTEARHLANMLAQEVELDATATLDGQERIVKYSIEYIDRIYQFYGAAYKYFDGRLTRFTPSVDETSPINIMDYPEFVEAINTQESGDVVIGYTPVDQGYRDLNLYFRWMPLYAPPEQRFLTVIGVSEYSVSAEIPFWVSLAQWISTLITFALNSWLIIMLVRLGHIYHSRNGDKWRNRRDE
jgi:hypothetical protein